MDREDIIPRIVMSAHALARIAAQDARNDAPSAQWRLLGILEPGNPLRVGALARAARTTQPGMTRLIGELERVGLLARTPDPDDSRATLVAITPAGADALHEWRREFRTTLAPRFADLDDDDWRVLARAAELLRTHSIEHEHQTGDME
ncbi:MarR family transcriptional regulator [Microbacterium sp.]|uniref:MarR family winged helix-turn-helix transcriptional regulator n=1 Tax=Microbacterium sp. TaxID=51671 RepID=UPI00333ED3CB